MPNEGWTSINTIGEFTAQTLGATHESDFVINYSLPQTHIADLGTKNPSYPFEIGTRVTEVLTSSGVASLGEFHGSYWPTGSIKRWGMSAAYAQSFLSTGATISGLPFSLSLTNVDLRYKLISGVANHDEEFGPMIPFQNTRYEGYSEPM